MEGILLRHPENGRRIILGPKAGTRLVLGFPIEEAMPERSGDDMVFAFADGSELVLRHVYGGQNRSELPEFEVRGRLIPGERFLAAFDKACMSAEGEAGMSGIHGIQCHDPLRGQEPGTREAVGSEGPMPEHYSVHNLFNSEEGGDDILFGADSGDIFFRGSGSGIIARYPDDAAMGGAGGSGPSFGADTAFDALFSHDGSMHDIELLILDGGDKEDTPFITSLTDLAKMSLATDNSPLPR